MKQQKPIMVQWCFLRWYRNTLKKKLKFCDVEKSSTMATKERSDNKICTSGVKKGVVECRKYKINVIYRATI